jgi:hypothetical protein
MIESRQPLSAGWWLSRLAQRLVDRGPHYARLESYYTGTANIPAPATKATRQAYSRLMGMARMNWAELVVEAVRERMQPQAFRTGADGDENGDAEAWRLWQANSLDADSGLVHRASLGLGCGYVIVGGVDDEIGAPLITPEDPRQVVVECDPAHRRKVLAALKLYHDDVLGRWVAYLYLASRVGGNAVVLQAVGPGEMGGFQGGLTDWDWLGDPQVLPTRSVPVVAFPNQANLMGTPVAEFERHLGLLDRIQYSVLNRLEIMTLQAFRQRMIKGVPDKDENGEQIDYSDIFASDPAALWVAPETATMWESGVVDLGPIRQAIRDDVMDLAATTRTPLFYLTPDASNGSAEGASLAREGLVFKTQDRLTQAGEAWEQVMALAFEFAGDPQRASRRDMEIVWASPERFSLSERYDAASKAQAAGVPWRTVMSSVLQYSPQEVDRMAADRVDDALLLASAVPAGGPAGTVATGPSAADVKAAADAMGVLIRAGVDPDDAAAQVGLSGLTFTGAVPTSLRLPQTDAQGLEGA